MAGRGKYRQKLDELILLEKERGTPDIEIGKKYGVNFRYIERLITRARGLNVSRLTPAKPVKSLQPAQNSGGMW
jgi:hypothetical protein